MVGKFIPVYEGEDQERPSKGCDHKKIANGCPDARRTKGAGHYVEFWGLKCLGNGIGAFSKLFSVAYEEIEKGGDFKNVVTTGTRSEGPSLRRDGVQF